MHLRTSSSVLTRKSSLKLLFWKNIPCRATILGRFVVRHSSHKLTQWLHACTRKGFHQALGPLDQGKKLHAIKSKSNFCVSPFYDNTDSKTLVTPPRTVAGQWLQKIRTGDSGPAISRHWRKLKTQNWILIFCLLLSFLKGKTQLHCAWEEIDLTKLHFLLGDHAMLETPLSIWALKLSSIGPG